MAKYQLELYHHSASGSHKIHSWGLSPVMHLSYPSKLLLITSVWPLLWGW